jgi:hypothetical protein
VVILSPASKTPGQCLEIGHDRFLAHPFPIEGSVIIQIFDTVPAELLTLTLSDEDRRSVCENRVLRGTVGPKRDEMKGGWRKLHNEELHNLYSLQNIIRMIKSSGMN